MKSSYETAGILDLGKADQMILGMKFINPANQDAVLGPGFEFWLIEDIDESDE